MFEPDLFLQRITAFPTVKRSTLFFVPTSLAALLLIILACNGFSAFCIKVPLPAKILLETNHFLPENAVRSTSSAIMYAVREETPLSKVRTDKKFQLFQQSGSLVPPMNSTVSHRLKRFRKSKSRFKILQSSVLSKQFSARVKDFFFHGKSPCELRFFMTWISSLESFGYREIFTLESLFKSHPHACLLILSNTMDSRKGNRLLKPFSDRGFRVMAVSPDFSYLFKNTFAESWFDQLRKGNVDPGEVSLGQNLSNLLRLAVLYKFGGVYVDTDVIILKSFSSLKNAIGAQTSNSETGKWSRLNNAVMVFDKNHPLLYKFLEEFALTFNGNKWGHNGPYLVSRVVSRVPGRPGFNFTVLPPTAFYPVDWRKIPGLFHRPRDGTHLKWISAKLRNIQKGSFALHLWNKRSRNLKVEEGSIISHIISDCCVFCNSSMSSL